MGCRHPHGQRSACQRVPGPALETGRVGVGFHRRGGGPLHHAGSCRPVDGHAVFHPGGETACRHGNRAAQDAGARAGAHPGVARPARVRGPGHRRGRPVPDGVGHRQPQGGLRRGSDHRRRAGPAGVAMGGPPRDSVDTDHHAGRGSDGRIPRGAPALAPPLDDAAGGRCHLPFRPGRDRLAAECPRRRPTWITIP